jgi:uncharacterized coiled-coil protein SlyX
LFVEEEEDRPNEIDALQRTIIQQRKTIEALQAQLALATQGLKRSEV